MKILIGCDVDPVLPARLTRPPDGDIWSPLDRIPELVRELGSALPSLTWLIRADETIRFCTNDFASGYRSRRTMWDDLAKRGHELGWHMHLLSLDAARGEFTFHPRPDWLGEAHAALASEIPLRATRTGWDYGSNFLFQELDRLGIEIDFSALPGNRVWCTHGSRFEVDWLRCSDTPYRPARADYERPGSDPLRLIEVPVAQFRNSVTGTFKRIVWRLLHGCFSPRGLRNKTRLLTDPWGELPVTTSDVWAFYFHPEDLTEAGTRNLAANLERLRRIPGAEFVTAGAARRWCDESDATL